MANYQPLITNKLYAPNMNMGTLRAAVHERVLNEMLGSVNQGGWKVLVLDDLTTRVLSSTLKVSDIMDCNVSVIEDLFKLREPMPIPAMYFIQPTPASVTRLLEDFSGSQPPPYASVHIFFSSKVPPEALARIKACSPLLKCLRTLKEGNLEFLTVDSHTMITEHPLAAVKLMGGQGEGGPHDPKGELESISTRLCTLMSTLHEFPAIRYRLGKTPEPGDPPGAEARRLLADSLARVLDSKLGKMQQDGQLPSRDTCDLLILDRSYDPVAPIIHEWTYEAMVYDLLEIDDNVYRYQPDASRGEEKEAVLGENDSLWVELRHLFIAEVYTSLAARFNEFQSKNRAAKQLGGGVGFKDKAGEMSTSNIRALIQALPQYRDLLAKLSLHIQMSSDLKQVTSHRQLTEVGELEQDLVLGEKNSKDLINFLAEHHDSLERMDKMRLFMCYCATHPGKLDETRQQQWMTLAKLSNADLAAVCNLAYMGVQVVKPAAEKGGFFNSIKDKKGEKEFLRKRKEDGNDYSLFRFEPLLKSIVSNMSAGSLPLSEYPYLRPPAPSDLPANMRPAATRPTGLNWAKRGTGGEGGSVPTGRRLIVFIIGGAVRSEMRVVHELSQMLGRDVLLGSTSLETPESFMDTLYKLTV